MHKLRNWLVSALLVWTVGMILMTPPVEASEPKGDYWFTETLTMDGVKLPPGIIARPCDTSAQPRACLSLENHTDTALYVMSLNYTEVLVMQTPDPGWKGRVNAAHEAASYYVLPDHPVTLSIEALTDLDHSLVDRNVLSVNPPPEDAPVPASQSSMLLLVYGEQVIEMPFTLAYTRNQHFDNGTGGFISPMATMQAADSATATQQTQVSARQPILSSLLVPALVGAAIALAAGWLVWTQLIRRRW